mgnify:CR=1 FL=1
MTESRNTPNTRRGAAISSLVSAFHCPRQYYFSTKHEQRTSERYTICKQVSCADAHATVERLWEMVCLIHPGISEEKKEFLNTCLVAMKHAPARPWSEIDILVRSERTGIYGLLDKYYAPTGEYALTRCTTAPPHGCWPEDAVRTAALLLCIEECMSKRGDASPKGLYIEYIPSGVIRYYEPSLKDRRRVIHLVRTVKEVEKGFFPPKPLNPPCSRCQYTQSCAQHEPRRLSFLFKQ